MTRYTKTSTSDNLLGCLVGIVGFVLIVTLVGWAFSALWNWIMPLFWHAAPHLTVWQACGVLFLLGFLTRGFRVTYEVKK